MKKIGKIKDIKEGISKRGDYFKKKRIGRKKIK
jgi:hypothetical protein